MLRLLVRLLCLLPTAVLADYPAPPGIAIIIDDLGYHQRPARTAIDLPGAVTLSFLPDGPHSAELAERAHRAGKEIMLHLPMQAQGQHYAHQQMSELMLDMDQAEFLDTLYHGLAAIPYISGINNHRGSLLTSRTTPMVWLMQALYEDGELFFVDSRTCKETIAADMAQAYDIPVTSRNVFLDNEPDVEAVRKQFRELLQRARRDGSALAIGHPHPATLRVLGEELPRLAEYGLQLLPVSRLIERQQQQEIAWQGYSSR